MKAAAHAGLVVCSCCGSVRLFGHEAAECECACVCVYLAGLGVFMSAIGTDATQTQQAAKEKHQRK